MSRTLRIQAFEPLALHLRLAGPFQDQVMTVEFITAQDEPSNFFILLSRNGRGKTTILEAMTHLVGMLAPDDSPEARPSPWRQGFPHAELQLDVRVRAALPDGGGELRAVLSLLDGVPGSGQHCSWTQEELRRVDADTWLRFGRVRTPGGALRDLDTDDVWVEEIRATLAAARTRKPVGFELDDPDGPSERAPTLLYFPDDRGLARHDEEVALSPHREWDYRTVFRFGREEGRWQSSTDYLLVWLSWLDDGKGRFTRAQKLVNDYVFAGTPKFIKRVDKARLRTVVGNGPDLEHRLDQLSSGERSLVQLYVRLGAAMTRNTWLLIDEVDLHLHPEWRRWAIVHLKELARRTPGLTVIFTAHSKEVLDWFDPEVDEPSLRKSGHIIDEGFVSVPPAEERGE